MPPAGRDILHDAARRRRHALNLFRRAAAVDPPIDRTIADGLELLRRFIQVDRCAYAVRETEGDSFRLIAGIGWEAGVIGRETLSGRQESLGGHTLLVGRPVIVEDIRLFPAFGIEPLLASSGMRSALTAPVRGQRGVAGLLGAFSLRRALFSLDEAEFLFGLADVVAAALYRQEWKRQTAVHRPPDARPRSAARWNETATEDEPPEPDSGWR
jgi:GAF domain-containing protein